MPGAPSLGSTPAPHSTLETHLPPGSALHRPERGSDFPGPRAGPGPSHGFPSAGLHTNSSRPCWHPKPTFVFVGEDGEAEEEALGGLGNRFSDFF